MITQSENPPVIELCGATKRYGRKLACDAVDLNVCQGTTFGLLGPNGAGKSSLIRMLMGLTPPDAGEVKLFGENARVHNTAMRQRIGYVPEVHCIYRWMKVEEVLGFVCKLYPRWDHDLTDQMLSAFELPLKKKVAALSKGMTTKLSLILALAHNPDLLILDEPTSGLDPVIREDFLESVLQRHLCKGRTVLFSSHHFDDVERVADEVGIFVDGRFIARGRIDELRSNIKRIQIVLPDGKLPTHIPEQAKIYLGIAGAWEAVSLVYRYPFFSILVSMIGGSLIASLWAKSNAVATLCGVLPPIVIGVAIARVAMVWNIELPEQGWFNVFSLVAASFGLCCIVASGCIYRVQREF